MDFAGVCRVRRTLLFSTADGWRKEIDVLPIRHRAVAMEACHRDFRLKGMFGSFGFVDFDADTGRGRRVSDSALDQHGTDDDIIPPGDVAAHYLLD